LYGISLETDKGVIVDNIPMRGCSGNIFTKIDSVQLSDFYRETNTRLIILQFGGNMIPQTENPSTIRGYVRSTMRQQVRYLRACAPEASILFIGPSDMSTNIDGQMTTYPLVPYMDQQFRKMAQEEGIAYWSMYDAMGGKDSMVRWVENGLAGSDYVHFTRAGANNIGKKLYNWLMSYQSDSLHTKL
jgi:lysophospholipase L1-like esterase